MINRVANEVVGGLKGQPLALALIVINVLYLGFSAWVLNEVKETRTAFISQCADMLKQR